MTQPIAEDQHTNIRIVIHINLTPEQGIKDLPQVLSAKAPVDSLSNLGSQTYTNRPFAIAVGGGFNDQAFQEIKSACKDVEQGIAWIRADTTQLTSMPSLNDHEAFGAAMAKRVKSALNELGLEKGEEESRKEGVYLF
jgi:hypothetical protein